MSVTSVSKDAEALTMTVTAEYDASPERAWALWADPRQLERWWGPPMYPATVHTHDLVEGGRVTYSMTGPEGDTHYGYWTVVAVEPARRLEVVDGFADADGAPTMTDLTTRMVVDLAERPGGGVAVTIVSTFPSVEVLEQMLGMGMEEGLREAMGQIDAILAAG